MFTGIVEERGEVAAIVARGGAARLAVRAPGVVPGVRVGDSVAVNGVCLSIIEYDESTFTADVMAETLARSTLGGLRPGSPVNLERAVTLATRMGGHLVQGHVDGIATVLAHSGGAAGDVVRIALPTKLGRYVVAKGSITVDGVSLTVSALGDDWFEVSLIPTTLAATTLGDLRPGSVVNLEVDVVAKYVEKLLAAGGAG